MGPNYVLFRKFMLETLPREERDESHMSTRFLKDQFQLLQSGVRDVRIHDSTCYAWMRCGGKLD
jgi:hypothetical protein